ncbi:hypothetical protein ACFV4M_01935 [Kitasatospora indigofera]|uniref:hypothetical protein n=1 Tax=Kitasatospora indigofera TaxID=67307 RepID=UPI0036576F9E
MAQAGMSTRAIGSAVGVHHDTVHRDVQATVGNPTVDGHSTVLSLDGRERPASRPAPDPYTWVEPDAAAIPGQDLGVQLGRVLAKTTEGHRLGVPDRSDRTLYIVQGFETPNLVHIVNEVCTPARLARKDLIKQVDGGRVISDHPADQRHGGAQPLQRHRDGQPAQGRLAVIPARPVLLATRLRLWVCRRCSTTLRSL